MPTVHLAFQEGFQGDTVIVSVDEAEVHRRDGLKTRMQIGLAGSHDVDVPAGPALIRVEVPTRSADARVPVDLSAGRDLYVGVSITPDGAVVPKVSDEPFRYA